jgi:bacterioferritin-associated ferredoxin
MSSATGRSFRFHRRRALGSRLDPLRPVGRLAERWPPWFYEHRLLRGRLALTLLRHLPATERLGKSNGTVHPRRFEEIRVETFVVGKADRVLGVYPDRLLGVLTDDALQAVHFERLVVDAGSHVRLPPIRGNDLPGVIGLDALDHYGGRPRVALWGPAGSERLVERRRLDVVWASERAPASISGRGRVERVDGVACDLFVSAVTQPAIELALQAGARATLTEGELPILVVDETPDWLEVRAQTSSGVPDVPADDEAFACLCEDVRVKDLRACVASGFAHVELVKRRTGAMTGPCQGKLCAAAVLSVLREQGLDVAPPTPRPLLHPVPLRELAADA